MIEIRQRRVSNINSHLPQTLLNRPLLMGVRVDQVTEEAIKQAGFDLPVEVGQSILPRGIGPITRFNANGKEIPQRDQPKETLYRDFEFTRTEWHGRDREVVTDFVWVPYQRYPRRIVTPPEVHLNVISSPDGTTMIVGDYIEYTPANTEKLKHSINLFLELFGYCAVLERGENPLVLPKMKKLHWDVLPPGKYPWERIRERLVDSLEKQAPKALAAALNRFEAISRLEPDFTALGNGGYQGYVVFGFSSLKLFVLESQKPNNAIYVFGEDWEHLSQLTKAEILQGNLQKHRIIHTERWLAELRQVLGL